MLRVMRSLEAHQLVNKVRDVSQVLFHALTAYRLARFVILYV